MTQTVDKWGPEIKVDGVRPGWLKDGDGPSKVYTDGGWSEDYEANYPVAPGWKWLNDDGSPRILSIKLKADHPHYKTLEATQPVDWSKPIEAYHADGRVVAVRVVEDCSADKHDKKPYRIDPALEFRDAYWFSREGTHERFPEWRIRNTTPVAKHPQIPTHSPVEGGLGVRTSSEALERMEALVRRMAAFYNEGGSSDAAIAAEGVPWMRDANAIVALLPEPVDLDLVEARRIAANTGIAGFLWSHIERGMCDGNPLVIGLVAGLKRGRELAEGEGR